MQYQRRTDIDDYTMSSQQSKNNNQSDASVNKDSELQTTLKQEAEKLKLEQRRLQIELEQLKNG